VRKTKFADHPGVIPELDLVEEDDKITHTVSLDDNFEG
jgi:pre-mRNA-splicing factor CWC22